jgi:uncharacterized protein (DUF362 family)
MKSDNKVMVTFDQGPFENAKKALSSLDLAKLKNKSVLIKPNIGRIALPESGINTHPEAIAGVIEALLENGNQNIAIGESPIAGVKTPVAFDKAGITAIAKKYQCKLIDFDSIKPKKVPIPNCRLLGSTLVCSPVFEYDILLSLPVAKFHMHTGVTLGIKNLKGCLYKKEKVKYHQLEYQDGHTYPEKTLDTAISDLATILLPHLTVIDGYMGMEGLGPSGGEKIKSDFAVASFNPLGADAIGCLMMGQDPHQIDHLRLISERLNISINPVDYQVQPVNYLEHQALFKKPPQNIAIEYPDVKLCDRESCSACLSTVMLFLKRFKSDMSQYLNKNEILSLAIGKGISAEELEDHTIFIGNCARNHSHKGIFVPGCPPVPTRIYKAITGKEPEKNEPH